MSDDKVEPLEPRQIDMTGVKVPEDADLYGVDGNVFSIIGYTSQKLRRAGNEQSVIDRYIEQAQASDYGHAIRVSMLYCGML